MAAATNNEAQQDDEMPDMDDDEKPVDRKKEEKNGDPEDPGDTSDHLWGNSFPGATDKVPSINTSSSSSSSSTPVTRSPVTRAVAEEEDAGVGGGNDATEKDANADEEDDEEEDEEEEEGQNQDTNKQGPGRPRGAKNKKQAQKKFLLHQVQEQLDSRVKVIAQNWQDLAYMDAGTLREEVGGGTVSLVISDPFYRDDKAYRYCFHSSFFFFF